MHITLEADYAVRIVYCLAVNQKRMDAKHIAETTGVTLRFSLKILRKLVGAGLLKSFKGTQGGYEIAKPLEDMSLNDVIETIQGPYSLNKCSESDFVCTRFKEKPCQFQKVYTDISSEVTTRLQAAKFSELIKD
ncbi:MAG: Rrf2 family transcriptional regulator [Oscillospiraceae bacterium]